MRTYVFKVLLVAASYLLIHCCVILFLPGLLPSAYWVREMIIVKRFQASQLPTPKIVFSGGSSVLFGIDASMVQAELKVPAENLGLHAGMRLDWLLKEAERTVSSGDLLVLALEPNFYECQEEAWTNWQLYSALTWADDFLPASLPSKINAVLQGGSVVAPLDKIAAYWDYMTGAARVAPRMAAMVSPDEIIARYNSDQFRTSKFGYSAYNLDENGDLQNTSGSRYVGDAEDVNRPNGVCPRIKEELRAYISKMQGRGVRVVFEYFPYLVSGTTPANWTAAEQRFDADIAEIGSQLVGKRDEFFFPRNFFLNTVHHLNDEGRKVATGVIIHHLQKLDLAKLRTN